MDNRILAPYRDNPMNDGDAVLFIEEHQLATEIEGLADSWDDVLCRNLATVLHEIGARSVQVAIARPEAALEDRDHHLVAELHEELAGSGVVVHPIIALPAAA